MFFVNEKHAFSEHPEESLGWGKTLFRPRNRKNLTKSEKSGIGKM